MGGLTLLGVGGATAAAFSPDSISGMLGWWKADAIGLNNGDPVATWEDSHTTNLDLTQGTGAARPTYQTSVINSLPVVRFDGTDDVLSVTASISIRHVFVVAKNDSATTFTGNEGLVSAQSGAASPILDGANATTEFEDVLGGDTYRKNGIAFAAGDYQGPMGVFAYISYSFNAFAVTAFQVGRDRGLARFWDGDVAEVLIYDSVLSSTDRDAVEGYLQAKYAL